MCNVGDDNFEENESTKYMISKTTYKICNKQCNKCKIKEPNVVLQHKHAYCKDCFLSATTHKFRSYLGSLKLSYSDENLLIIHKGGHQSTAIMHLLRTGLEQSQYKKLKMNAIILYIEDQYYLTIEERKEILKKVKEEVTGFKFDIYFASLNDFLTTNKVKLFKDWKEIEMHENEKCVINNILKENPNKTILQEILDLYKKRLITEVGNILNCKWALTPNVSFHYASNILTDICLGRGANGLLNSRINLNNEISDVKILTPFMDLDIRELAFYNYFNNIIPVTYRMPLQNNYSCVQNLMKKFVEDLQVSYPSTITTIVKTGEKLTINKMANYTICSFCQSPKEENSKELSSGESTNFSHWISTNETNQIKCVPEDYENLQEHFQTMNMNNKYCYRCNEIIKYII